MSTSLRNPFRIEMSLDPRAGETYADKPIFDHAGVIGQIDSGARLDRSDDVFTFGFFNHQHALGLNNNKSFGEGKGYTPFTAEQMAAARLAVGYWDDLIPQSFQEVTPANGASDWGRNTVDIWLANTSTGPAQAWAYFPGYGQPYSRVAADTWIADPAVNWSNAWLTWGGYGNTTVVHELGHSLGLNHPGNYNFSDDNDGDGQPDPITYEGDAFYAQDTQQYTIMSYFEGDFTGTRIVEWTTFQFSNPQAPLVHDILTVQSIYGSDPDTRVGDTVYGFNSDAGRDLFDFSLNPYPYLAVYDAGGNDTIDLSGFTASQFIDLHAGSFSSIGAGAPTAAVVNAARAELFDLAGLPAPAPRTQAQIDGTVNAFMTLNAADILEDTGVAGIRTSEYDNFAIAYGTTIENAIGGSARDLIHGNEVDNVLSGLDGDDVLNGFEGADTLIGGNGSDTFVFEHLELGDVISDFGSTDVIDLSGLGGGTTELSYIEGAAFSGTAGEVRYENGVLQADMNGDLAADFAVTLDAMPALMADQLVLANG